MPSKYATTSNGRRDENIATVGLASLIVSFASNLFSFFVIVDHVSAPMIITGTTIVLYTVKIQRNSSIT